MVSQVPPLAIRMAVSTRELPARTSASAAPSTSRRGADGRPAVRCAALGRGARPRASGEQRRRRTPRQPPTRRPSPHARAAAPPRPHHRGHRCRHPDPTTPVGPIRLTTVGSAPSRPLPWCRAHPAHRLRSPPPSGAGASSTHRRRPRHLRRRARLLRQRPAAPAAGRAPHAGPATGPRRDAAEHVRRLTRARPPRCARSRTSAHPAPASEPASGPRRGPRAHRTSTATDLRV